MEKKLKLDDQDSFVTCYLGDQEVEIRIREIEILPSVEGDPDCEIELTGPDTFDCSTTVRLTLSRNALKFLTERYEKSQKQKG